MKKIFYFLFLLLIIPIVSSAFQDEYNRRDEQGQRQGPWRGYFSTGTIRYEGNFVDDKPTGVFKYFYPQGQLRAELIHEPGKEAVEATYYHRNRRILGKGKYVNQKMEGEWLFYNEQGVLVSEHHYEDGKNHGVWKTFFTDGTVAEKEKWVKGEKNGKLERFYPDGSIYMIANYRNDLLNGDYKLLYPDGKPMLTGKYTENINEGEWIYYTDEGQIQRIVVYENGVITEEKVFIETDDEAIPIRPGPSRQDQPWESGGF
jgi:antitoxin component YwqK of YwqJK toxin-antitoxin module